MECSGDMHYLSVIELMSFNAPSYINCDVVFSVYLVFKLKLVCSGFFRNDCYFI